MYVMYLIFSKTLTPLSGKCSLLRTKSQKILTPYKNIVSAGVMSYCKSRRTSHHDPDNSPQQKDLLTSVHNILNYINSTAVLMWSWLKHAVDSVHISYHSNRILWIWKQSCDISKQENDLYTSIKHDLARSCFQLWPKIGSEGRKKLLRLTPRQFFFSKFCHPRRRFWGP